MKQIPKFLSKSKLVRGEQCLKYIYLTVHHPELEEPVSPELQAVFDQGRRVGEVARSYFPGGVLVNAKPWEYEPSLRKTRELIAVGTEIIYEAAFEYQGCYLRADIIQFSKETKRWKVLEVKGSTKIEEKHKKDIAIQGYVIEKSGLPVESLNMVYLNRDCRYPALENLFVTQDLTDEIRGRYPEVEAKIKEIAATLQKNEIPKIDIGPHCTDPYDCPFMANCWREKKIPELSVLNLTKGPPWKWDYYAKGIVKLDDPRLSDLNELQSRVVHAFKSGERFIDTKGIKEELASWKFPLIFLDFETINPALPLYEGVGPYDHVPFQFSVHVWPSPDAALSNEVYLHAGLSDPRPTLIPALLTACGDQGSIVAYYHSFESGVIKDLAAFSPAHKTQLQGLIARLVDPLPIIRDHVYDNAFAGSFSLKNVGPALLGKAHSYEGMLVYDGGAAQRAYEELMDHTTSSERRSELSQALIDYCRKDTEVMVELVKWLYRV